jgi:RNA polymerase sigma factor (sigma-70 family)
MATSDDGWAGFTRYRDTSLTLREREAAFETLYLAKREYIERAAERVMSELCNGTPPRGVDYEQMGVDAFYVLGKNSEAVDTTPKKYLWGILRNLAHKNREHANKRLDRHALSFESLLVPPTGHPADPEALLLERQRVSEAIAQLSPALQEVIDLHDYQGHSFPEIDKLLGLKPGGARQRHCRARLRLAEILIRPFHPKSPTDEPRDPEGPELD